MRTRSVAPRIFTGWHMLAILVSFFAVVIAVNLTLAVYASRSWTGLVVENSYVSSQEFNDRLAQSQAQDALGWTGKLTVRNGVIRYGLTDAKGAPAPMTGVTVRFRHPAYESEDETVVLEKTAPGEFSLRHPVRDGIWIVEIDTDAGLRAPYVDAVRVTIRNGSIR